MPFVAGITAPNLDTISEKRLMEMADSPSPGRPRPTLRNMKDIYFGTVNLGSDDSKIVFLFPGKKEDPLLKSLLTACEESRYQCSVATSPEGALAQLAGVLHSIMVVDARHQANFDPEVFVREMNSSQMEDVLTLVAIVSSLSDQVVPGLISVGYSRILPVEDCERRLLMELKMAENAEAKLRRKIMFAYALFEAVDHSNDSIEITTPHSDGEIMYVNKSFEEITEYSSDEAVGLKLSEIFGVNEIASRSDLSGSGGRGSFRKTERAWEGESISKQKSGSVLRQHVKFLPIANSLQRILHYVTIRNNPHEGSRLPRLKINGSPVMGESTVSLQTRKSLGSFSAKSMIMKETPMWKVIYLLRQTTELPDCTAAIRETLDHAVDILLKLPEQLYTLPEDASKEDPDAKDFVNGLMRNTRRFSFNVDQLKRQEGNQYSAQNYHRVAPAKLRDVLQNSLTWEFDIMRLEQLCQHQTLYYLGLEIFNAFNVCKFLRIEEKCLGNWLQLMEKNYHRKNLYHNSTHAADVLQCAAYFIQSMQENEFGLEDAEICSILIACVIHDLDHPARTNPFLCNTNHELAVLYNDTAVLENHHSALAFKLTRKHSSSNIFKHLDKSVYSTMRSAIIDLVMATDMSRHFEHLTKFKALLSTVDTDSPAISSLTTEQQLVVKRVLVKTADISNAGRPLNLCVEWAKRIAGEYMAQCEEEKKYNLPLVLPAFEKSVCFLPKTQVQFVDFFISELYEVWNNYLEIPNLLIHVRSNYEHWKKEVALKERRSSNEVSTPS